MAKQPALQTHMHTLHVHMHMPIHTLLLKVSSLSKYWKTEPNGFAYHMADQHKPLLSEKYNICKVE